MAKITEEERAINIHTLEPPRICRLIAKAKSDSGEIIAKEGDEVEWTGDLTIGRKPKGKLPIVWLWVYKAEEEEKKRLLVELNSVRFLHARLPIQTVSKPGATYGKLNIDYEEILEEKETKPKYKS